MKAEIENKINHYSKAIEQDSKNALAYRHRADSYYEAWEQSSIDEFLDLAFEDYSQAIELYKEDAEVYSRRTTVCEKKIEQGYKEYEDIAIQDYSTIIELIGNYLAELYNEKAIVFQKNGWVFSKNGEPVSINIVINDPFKLIELIKKYSLVYHYKGCSFMDKIESDIIEQIDDAIQGPLIAERFVFIYYHTYDYALTNRGRAFLGKGIMNHDIDSLDSAIKDFSTSIEMTEELSYNYCNRGRACAEKGLQLGDKRYLDCAIEDYSKAIEKEEVASLKAYYFFLRGNTFADKGGRYSDLDSSKFALRDYTLSILLYDEDVNVYFNRGKLYWEVGNVVNSISDMNTALYLLFTKKKKIEPYFMKMHEIIEGELFHILFLLLCIGKEKELEEPLLFELIETSALMQDFLLIFEYLGFDFANLNLQNKQFNKVIPIIAYYLKGSVIAYRYYDEILDNGENKLTAQDYYYYVQSARKFSKDTDALIGEKAILSFAIENTKNAGCLKNIDYYYIGLLFTIQLIEEQDKNSKSNLRKQAKKYFELSNSFIWSKRMIDVLNNLGTNQELFDEYIHDKCNKKRELAVDSLIGDNASELEFMDQFADYIHLQEVESVFVELIDIYEEASGEGKKSLFSDPVIFHDQLWEVFGLSDKSVQKLGLLLLKHKGEEVFQGFVDNTKVIPVTQEEVNLVKTDYHLYTTVVDGKTAICMMIKDMVNGMNQEEYYLLLRYLATNNIIDKIHYITLAFYYKFYINDVEYEKDSKIVREVFWGILGSATLGWLSLFVAIMAVITEHFVINELEKSEYMKYSNYLLFSDNMWKLMNNIRLYYIGADENGMQFDKLMSTKQSFPTK